MLLLYLDLVTKSRLLIHTQDILTKQKLQLQTS